MSSRPKQRSTIARRVFLAAFISLVLLIGGVIGLSAWFYETLIVELSRQPPESRTWSFIQQYAYAWAFDYWPAIVGLLVVTLLLAWLLARWALRPLNQLVSATRSLRDEASRTPLPVRAVGEVGVLAQSFNELSGLLVSSSRELERQNLLMQESVQRLEGLWRIGRELSTIQDADQLLWRVAAALHGVFEYEAGGVVLVDGPSLLYYGHDGAALASPTPLVAASVVSTVVQTHNVARVDDVRGHAGYVLAPGLRDARAELAVPVGGADRLLAVLVVQSRKAAAFSEQDEQQLIALSGLLEVALVNVGRLSAELSGLQLAELIHRITRGVNSASAPEVMPDLALDQLALGLPYDRAALFFVEGEWLVAAAVRGIPDHHAALARVRLAEAPLLEQVLEQGRPAALDDAAQAPAYRPLPEGPPARSWLAAPVQFQGRAIGVLVLEADQPGLYGEGVQHAVATIAYQLAGARESARFQARVQELSRQLEVVRNVTQVIATRDVSDELPGVLRTIVHQIRRIVPCDLAAIALYTEHDDTFFVDTAYDYTVRDWSDLPSGQTVAADGTPWQTVCRTAGPLVQSDLTQSVFEYDRQLAEKGLRSSVVVPMIIGTDRPIGALNFASREPAAYGRAQLETMLELSQYLGTKIYNERLKQEKETAAIELARTQEHLNMVDKVRAVGQLASGVAHDFNNLLAGVLGNTQLLLLEVQDDEQRQMLKVIEQAAKDGAATVRRLQGFARMEHDSPLTEVRLDMLARDAIDITRPRWRDVAHSRGVSIEIIKNLQPVTPIAGRPAELREVLTNLLINAVDAMPRGGTITVATYDDQISGEGGAVVVEVADTGVGIPPDLRARIFDPFFTTKGEQGTGLGLAVSLGIIQSHGGDIEVESQAGRGTCFAIRLPITTGATAPPPRRRVPAPVVPGRILLVENDPIVRDATALLLARWGHQVDQAVSGKAALGLLERLRYDVVISDLGMPDMNGWDLLGQVKQLDAQIATVLITGWGRQVSDEEARSRGVDYIVEKPFDQDDLRDVLAEAMAEKPA